MHKFGEPFEMIVHNDNLKRVVSFLKGIIRNPEMGGSRFLLKLTPERSVFNVVCAEPIPGRNDTTLYD